MIDAKTFAVENEQVRKSLEEYENLPVYIKASLEAGVAAMQELEKVKKELVAEKAKVFDAVPKITAFDANGHVLPVDLARGLVISMHKTDITLTYQAGELVIMPTRPTQLEGPRCQSLNIAYTTNPAQRKCNNCGKMWAASQPPPFCVKEAND